jgi:hypothetical protein
MPESFFLLNTSLFGEACGNNNSSWFLRKIVPQNGKKTFRFLT